MATLLATPKGLVSMCPTKLPLRASSTSTPLRPTTHRLALAASKPMPSEVWPIAGDKAWS
jgi:hypothetical protein